MILCLTLNPVLDATFFVERVTDAYRTESSRVTYVAGGKGNNAARALAAMGRPAHALTALGGMVGHTVAALLDAEAFASTPAWVGGETRLQVTTVDARGLQRSYFAPSAPFSAADAAAVRARYRALLPKAGAICLCGSSPGGEADALFPELIAEAAAGDVQTLVDSSGCGLALALAGAARPDIIKVNRSEAESWLGATLNTEPALRDALAALASRARRCAVLTLGEEGALVAGGREQWRALPPPVPAVNPIGSGDAMTAGLLDGWTRGWSVERCIRWGMAAAAANALSWSACQFELGSVSRLAPDVTVYAL
jgi:1-phosphofructokinase family hexose kinase